MAAAVRRGAAVIAGAGMLVALAFLPQVRGGRPRAACGGRDGGPPLPSRPPDPEHTMDPAASPGRARAAGAGALHVAETFLFHMRRNYIDVRAELYSDIAARLEAAGLPPAQDRSPQASDGARRRPGELFDEPQELQSSPWNSDRQIASVPGLKRFLMAHWRTHAAGRDHETPMTEIRRPEWFGPWPEEDYPPGDQGRGLGSLCACVTMAAYPQRTGDTLAGRSRGADADLGGPRLPLYAGRHRPRRVCSKPVRQREVRYAGSQLASRNGGRQILSGAASRRRDRRPLAFCTSPSDHRSTGLLPPNSGEKSGRRAPIQAVRRLCQA